MFGVGISGLPWKLTSSQPYNIEKYSQFRLQFNIYQPYKLIGVEVTSNKESKIKYAE